MVIKKYIAVTEEEAVALAKADLGKDVVIMNTKKKQPKGVLRLFQKPSVEITAAVDSVSEPAENNLPDFSELQKAIQETNAVLEADARKKRQRAEQASIQKEAITRESPEEGKADTAQIEERLDNLQDLLRVQMQSAKEEKEDKKQENGNQAYFDLIRKKLLDNEVEESYVDRILEDISEDFGKNATLDSILAGVYQKLVLKLGQPHLIDIKTPKTKFIFFVGPTGVGKTTTIAKIASTLKLTKKTKVALITADTYRIAAVEQLKTYANILGIPLQVVYSAEDMVRAMEELHDFDLVLVDTAGRSHNNQEQREDIQHFLEKVPEENREVFLVLSATTKYKDLVKISTTYSEMTKYNLIFTKLDETETVGNIFNIHMLTGAPLSYTTWGQNVPDDIGKIDAQNIAKQLLGGNG